MNSSSAAAKAALRRELRRRRSALPLSLRRRAAQAAAVWLSASPFLLRARRIAIYLPFGSELDTRPLIERLARRGTTLFVPRVDPREAGRMTFVEWRGGARLSNNRYGIPEPQRAARARAWALDAMVLPLVGFDREGHRLGSGAGYYDRWIAAMKGRRPRLIGYAYAAQEVEAIPAEPWDLALDAVCTERGFRYRCALPRGR